MGLLRSRRAPWELRLGPDGVTLQGRPEPLVFDTSTQTVVDTVRRFSDVPVVVEQAPGAGPSAAAGRPGVLGVEVVRLVAVRGTSGGG